jgi:hypothetical protein
MSVRAEQTAMATDITSPLQAKHAEDQFVAARVTRTRGKGGHTTMETKVNRKIK